jgi:hypothetical protein
MNIKPPPGLGPQIGTAISTMASQMSTLPVDVVEFLAGNTSECADANCTYDATNGWDNLADGGVFHEVDAFIAQKYDICSIQRPDLINPYGNSFYYHSINGLLNRQEMIDLINTQSNPLGIIDSSPAIKIKG